MKCPFVVLTVSPFSSFTFCLSDMDLFSLSNRPAGGESDNAGVLPWWRVVRRNSRSSFPLSNGRQRDGVYYSHHKTHERYNLDQVPHGPTWVPDLLRPPACTPGHIKRPHPSENLSCCFSVHISVLQVFHWCLCWLSNRLFKGAQWSFLVNKQLRLHSLLLTKTRCVCACVCVSLRPDKHVECIFFFFFLRSYIVIFHVFLLALHYTSLCNTTTTHCGSVK